jgi:hypothetical protein
MMELTIGSQVQRRTGENKGVGRIISLYGDTLARVAWDASWRIGGGELTTTIPVADLMPAGTKAAISRQRAALSRSRHGGLNPRARSLACLGNTAARRDAISGNHAEYRRVFDSLDSHEQEVFARAYDAMIPTYAENPTAGSGARYYTAVEEYLLEGVTP